MSVTPDADFNGDLTVTVIASDGQASGSDSFTLTVTPVNDAPELVGFEDQEIDEDTQLVFTITATDVDGDDLT